MFFFKKKGHHSFPNNKYSYSIVVRDRFHNMKIHLFDGSEVIVESFVFTPTNLGNIQNETNYELNKDIYKDLTYPSEWGNKSFLKIEPDFKDYAFKDKSAFYKVWLSLKTPIDSDYSGSELVVIWLDKLPGERTIFEIIKTGVEKTDWKKHAQDYS